MLSSWNSKIVRFGLAISLVLGSGIPAFSQECVQASTSMVAWWPFDETTGTNSTDIAGSNDGLHVGGPTPAAGLVDGSLRFDGLNDYVVVPDSDLWDFGTSDFTIEFWANSDRTAHGNVGHPGDVFISNDEGPFVVNKWFFALHSDGLEFLTGRTGDARGIFSPMADFAPVVGQWHHLAVRRSGSAYDIFVDGELAVSDANTSDIADADAPLTIGRALEPFGGFMDGRLDEVTVYNNALTEAELGAIFDAGSAGKCKGPSIDTLPEFAITLGKPHAQQFEVDAGQAPFSWSVTAGQLPVGMELSESGVFSGTPTELGSSTFTVDVVDGNGDATEMAFMVEVVLVPPPSDLRFHKSSTVSVPGRNVDYFIAVENAGTTTTENLEVLEVLHPISFFDLLASNPPPQQTNDMSILWILPKLEPGESAILSYTVALNPEIRFGTNIPGGVFVGTSGQAESASEDWARSLENASCKANTPECASLLFICAQAGCHPLSTLSVCSACPSIWAECTANCDHCELFPDSFLVDCNSATGPIDPNEKLVAAGRFIQPDQTLVYPIHFENIGEIEALDVFITDVLGANLDDSTLQIQSPGASYDPGTRTLRWDLLGRNLQPGETDNVLFSIKPVAGLPSGTEIRNSAEIRFEVFDPLVTPEVVNVIDTTPPSCVMDQLEPIVTTTDFTISWSGTDEVGEIEGQSIFVSEDGGPFAPFLEGTLETEVVFSGMTGKTYEFFCVAADTAGNIEPQVDVAETTTEVEDDAVVVPNTSAFALYRVKRSKGSPRFRRRSIILADQFDAPGQPRGFLVRAVNALGLPSRVDGQAIDDPDNHLVSYRIRRERGEAKDRKLKNVRVTNRFGEIFVDTQAPDRLLVPSLKDLEAPIDDAALPDPFPLDHFKCYRVKVTRGTAAFTPVQVAVEDQFEQPTLLDVLRPRRLCNPVDKNGEGIGDPDAHLLCYGVRQSDGERRFSRVKGIHVNNQFGPLQLDAKRVTELCIPSEKDASEAKPVNDDDDDGGGGGGDDDDD